MIAQHLPVLQVLVPLMSAPLCLLLRRPNWPWALTLLVTIATFLMALGLLGRVLATGTIAYEIGGWAAPWGIEYRIDLLSGFVVVLVTAVGAAVMLYAKASVEREISANRHYLFYCMYLLCLSGLLGITLTGDAFNLFVFLEISSLSSYVLISLGQDRRALTAAYNYLIMGTIGATFYIIGVGMMYMMTGTLNMADLAVRLPAVADTRTVMAALGFIVVALSLKLALFPLHLWLPNAYAHAPSVVTAFLASTATKVAVYALLRIAFTVFGAAHVFDSMPMQGVMLTLAVAGIFLGSLVAIYQTNAKRMLAYSSVAQIGYMILGMALANEAGLTGGIVHLFNHAMTKGALFLALGCVYYSTGSVMVKDMAGLGRRMPLTMAAFVVGGFSLIGSPLTVGFISKWYLVKGALDAGWWLLAGLIVAGSLLALVYIWRIVEIAYFREPSPDAPAAVEAPWHMVAPMWLMAAAALYFGIDATATADIAGATARLLLGLAP